MSEALKKFVLGKAKNKAAFDKKFSGPDGAVALLEVLGDAPKGVFKDAQKILQSNPSDIEQSAAAIAKLAYGAEAPAKRSGGIRNKKADAGERIEGTNLPQGDGGVLADPPAQPAKGRKGKKASSSPKAEVAATESAGQTPPPKNTAVDAEMDTEIGQFVPLEGAGGVDVAGPSFMPPITDPRTSMMVGADLSALPSSEGAFDMARFLSDPSLQGIGPDGTMPTASPPPNTPAPIEPKDDLLPPPQTPADWSSLDTSWMGAVPPASRPPSGPFLAGLMDEPAEPSTMRGPFRDGLFNTAEGFSMTPPVGAYPNLPGTISPDGGFLGMDQTPTQLNADGGFMGGTYGPLRDGLLDMASGDEIAPMPNPALRGTISPDGGFLGADQSPTPINNFGGFMGGDYGPTPPPPKEKRPPFYDPNRTLKDWWKEPGLASRANEFLYQRGMPGFMARSIQPAATVIDKGMKIGGPAIAGLGAAYGGLKGMEAVSQLASQEDSPDPPSDEEQEARAARADESMRRLQQILGGNTRNPASAPAQPPVQ